jgi:2,3-bisphosphoglycerate-independent phosphoglycerate mutase
LVLGNILRAYENGEFDIVHTREENGKKIEEVEEVAIRILITPDHATPLSLKTHTSEPVPFLVYDSSTDKKSGVKIFDENSAKATGVYIEDGHLLMGNFIER